jgi:hypothetical protein
VKKNTGTSYEILTQEVFSRIHAHEGLCTNVERNIFLVGKSGAKHQIDVTFTFKAAGISYRTIVQCKDWGSPVKQGQVLEFQQVLSEIPGQPRGIVVSRSGFQVGARTLAAHHGIKLYELREPRDEDWEGLIRTVETTVKILAPEFRNVRLLPDEGWVREQLKALGMQQIDLEVESFPGIDTIAYASGDPCDLNAIVNGYVPNHPCEGMSIRHFFESPPFLELANRPLPRLRIRGIQAEIVVRKLKKVLRVNLDHLVAYCLRDVLGGEAQFLQADGQPLGAK